MENLKIFGSEIIEEAAIKQIKTCIGTQDYGVLTADAHVGYAHPIGGAIAYKNHISLSGVGFDIACGNKAVRTNVKVEEVDISKLMDEVIQVISFGMGKANKEIKNHEIFNKIRDIPVKTTKAKRDQLFQVATSQLGSVGGGNHFVDIFKDEEGLLWIGVHFGSRGFGHKITTGFISIAQGGKFEDRAKEGGMFSKPILFNIGTETAQDYIQCLELAGEYAYAGRDWVVNRVLKILGNPEVTFEVHNHHNFGWKEEHFGEDFWVIRKGCTPAFPGQTGFIGSNMFDTSVIIEGVENKESSEGLYSTVHGAGRVLSRRKALGKVKYYRDKGKRKMKIIAPGLVNYSRTQHKAQKLGIELRGGGADESPECYKNLEDVLFHHGETINVLHRLQPVGVAMAGD